MMPFDFSDALPAGVTLGGFVKSQELNSGTGAVVLGDAQATGNVVNVPVSGGVAGSSYRITVLASTSDPLRNIEIVAILPVT